VNLKLSINQLIMTHGNKSFEYVFHKKTKQTLYPRTIVV